MNSIPRKIKIGSLTYKIELVPDLTDAEGEHLPHKQIIRIEKESLIGPQRIALWHESLHAANSELSHQTVDWLAHFIDQLLVDNRKVAEMYLE